MKRCRWVDEKSEIYVKYHDEEWGVPKYDDKELFGLQFLKNVKLLERLLIILMLRKLHLILSKKLKNF